ncbi:hypothetical protein AB6A40_003183 [Gnathostoma spinigerum]|uniref:Uncharacterized protein n=1 Tax=Gnathostoma spinigerum TaxID=75299 RepID=A0ABD6EGL1_9BILA
MESSSLLEYRSAIVYPAMMDVRLEEDSDRNAVVATRDIDRQRLLEERAKELFHLCDKSCKGFIVEADLDNIKDEIPEQSAVELQKFFDNSDGSPSNFVTESQFISGIKPLLLKWHEGERNCNEDESKSSELSTDDEDQPFEDRKENDSESDEKDKTIPVRKCFSMMNQNAIPAMDLPLQKKASQGAEQRLQGNFKDYLSISDEIAEVDTKFVDRLPDVAVVKQRTNIFDNFTGSLEDEILISKLGEDTDKIQNTVRSKSEYPFTATNVTNQLSSVGSAMDAKRNLKLNDLDRRETASQADLRKALFNPESKQSPSSRSLADELREVGVTNDDTPPNEPHSDDSPDRIFKVVFVGDSAVGKTCFLHRFCHDRFKPLFNATIGVDFTVKTIRLHDRVVAVQLWDTAGQERFRSITKQYFRKADGVILMYDVTSEQSFLNVRNWIASVRAGVDEHCVMCLVGNKVDLFGNDHTRLLTHRHGQRLAAEFGMMFFETSAFTGQGVNDCMRSLAMRLQEREDQNLEEALKLEMTAAANKKSWCCS